MDAFAVGVQEVKPKAEVHVRWIYEWFSPTAAKEAAEALIADGCDVFAFTEDSPTIVQVAGEKGLPSFGHYPRCMISALNISFPDRSRTGKQFILISCPKSMLVHTLHTTLEMLIIGGF